MRRFHFLASLILLLASSAQAETREYVLVHEESGKLSLKKAPGGAKEGDTLLIQAENLIFSDGGYKKDGEAVDVSDITFSIDDSNFAKLSDENGKALRFTLAMKSAFCGQQIDSDSLPEGIVLEVKCD